MTDDLFDPTHDLAKDVPDDALAALLRRAASDVPVRPATDLADRIVAQAALPLAGRRRALRLMGERSTADTLAAWVRVAIPVAVAAALIGMLALPGFESARVAEAELSDSDPAALFGALDANGTGDLSTRVITLDAGSPVTVEQELP